ncbi:MAG: cobalamin-dependent protein, partial [Pseudomonadota bacterium]
MKVSLISPFADISSIGLRSISAYLKSYGIATRLVFLPLQKNFYSREAFSLYSDEAVTNLAELVKHDDLIGISLMSNFYETVKDLTVKLKAKLPHMPIAWGGIHPTVMPEQGIETADYVCIGEGETPMLELCRQLAEGRQALSIPGIWAKANNEIFRNTPGHVILDLDEIPPQDYDLEDNYILVSKNKLIPITKDNVHTFLGVTYWTMYSRGCPFSCTYCCNDALRSIHKDLARVRSKSPEGMLREIVAIKKRFPFIR